MLLASSLFNLPGMLDDMELAVFAVVERKITTTNFASAINSLGG